MAYIKCASSNGTLSETVLWQNGNPTSSFADQTVTLSDDITNYTYIKFTTYSNTSNSDVSNVLVPVEDFITMTGQKNANFCEIELNATAGASGSTSTYTRGAQYASNTTIFFGSGIGLHNTNTNNSYLIPYTISGVK